MIAIIDYKAGNLTSVKLAFDAIGAKATITSDPQIICNAERVVFPGVGAAGAAMRNLQELGLIPVIRTVVSQNIPFLGICLGTQIILEHSEEDGGVETLGLIPGRVIRFQPTNPRDKVPHMGWNRVQATNAHPLLANIPEHSEFYFVHSYYPVPGNTSNRFAETTYAGVSFAAALGHKTIFATQFHPEKSGRIGLQLLKNFTTWHPKESL
ncbi:MAG: imidazole glycerol phosphate synthase subunit HisH [Kiritimatiellia bacterium]